MLLFIWIAGIMVFGCAFALALVRMNDDRYFTGKRGGE